MMYHEFYVYDINYELIVVSDCLGCTGIAVYANNCYKGIIDTADERDFLKIENKIVMDPFFEDSLELYV
ncbi:hypothetical protein H6K86_12005 [Staphylococcus epidermidis]|nr:hypothetical protein [Staphylococcus epidermidis]MBM6230750.1 hypothetical protein [Staphylococcus epidermidis]